MDTPASLELGLSTGTHSLLADVRFAGDDTSTDLVLARSVVVPLDVERLRGLSLDPDAYGEALTGMLFSDLRLVRAWQHAVGYARTCGINLHVRLRLSDETPVLHSLQWELLQDPTTRVPLADVSWIRLSRSLDVVEHRRRGLPERGALRAVVVRSNPPDLPQFGLSPIPQSLGQHCAAAISGLPTLLLDGTVHQPTLENIARALWRGVGILVVLAHATRQGEETYLWLTDHAGNALWVSGAAFVRTIAGLPRPPMLVVLASCWSGGGNDEERDISALAAQLARSGIDAVVGQVGAVPISVVGTALPILLQVATEQNDVLAGVAAANIVARASAWSTRLWCSTRTGELWRPRSAPRVRAEAAVESTAYSPGLSPLLSHGSLTNRQL
jgi:CHAT domain